MTIFLLFGVAVGCLIAWCLVVSCIISIFSDGFSFAGIVAALLGGFVTYMFFQSLL